MNFNRDPRDAWNGSSDRFSPPPAGRQNEPIPAKTNEVKNAAKQDAAAHRPGQQNVSATSFRTRITPPCRDTSSGQQPAPIERSENEDERKRRQRYQRSAGRRKATPTEDRRRIAESTSECPRSNLLGISPGNHRTTRRRKQCEYERDAGRKTDSNRSSKRRLSISSKAGSPRSSNSASRDPIAQNVSSSSTPARPRNSICRLTNVSLKPASGDSTR